jgi:hypothetical protein
MECTGLETDTRIMALVMILAQKMYGDSRKYGQDYNGAQNYLLNASPDI